MKLCIFCKKCDFDKPYAYSTYTAGDGAITCRFHKNYSAPLWEQDEYRKWILFAEVCDRYEEAK